MFPTNELVSRLPQALAIVEIDSMDSVGYHDEAETLDAIETFAGLMEIAIAEAASPGSLPLSSLSTNLSSDFSAMISVVRELVSTPTFTAAIQRSMRPDADYLTPGDPLPARNVPMADRMKTSPVVGGAVNEIAAGEVLGLPSDLLPREFRAWFALARFSARAIGRLARKIKEKRGTSYPS